MKHLVYLLVSLFQAYLGVSSSTGCGVGCTTCYNSTSCLVCQSGYYTTPNGACAACPPTCVSCTADGCFTDSCDDGYGWIDGVCLACAPNCHSCVAVNTCSIDSCHDGYFYNSTSLTCQLLDACLSQPCLNYGTCITYGFSYQCICGDYYVGSNCEDGVSKTIRLIDGATHHEGRIEILYNGAWGTVNGNSYDTNDAIVACRQLGSYGGTPLPTESTVDGAGPIWLDKLQCKGNEMSLIECYHSKPTVNDYHWRDVGVNCGCTSNCLHCIVDNTCLPNECSPGYYFNSTSLTCEACSPNCHYCTRPNTCEQNSCYSSRYYNTSLQACHNCLSGCSYCTSPYTCEPNGCSSGFVYNTTTRKCSRCANYCSYCSSENTCYPNRCYSGYTYDIATNKCLKCANYCYYCASAGTCVLNGCQHDYTFVLGNTSEPCIACDAGKDCTSTLCPTRGYTYDVQLQQCVACPPNCLYCPSGSECVSNGCNSGYIFNATTKTCQRVICSPGCYYCSSNGTCLSNGCSSRYAYNASSQACESCVNKCYSCKTPGTCTISGCDSGYVYDVENNTCKACIEKCSSCKVPNTCSVGGCWSRYAYDIENNTCRACTAYCAQCVIPNTCSLRGCDRDYYYDTEIQLCKLSPCKTNSMQCNNRGSCTSLTDYPYYQCTCGAGYTGLQCADACSPNCASCEAANTCLPNGCMPGYGYNSTTQTCTVLVSELYPYGNAIGDSVLLGNDDDSTSKIYFDQPFLFYGRFLSSAFINMNGFISFSINYLSYRPMPFPHDNSENADLLGVFWSDYDSTSINCDCTFNCRTCGRSVVYYHTYSLQEGKTDNVTLQVLSQATTDGLNYIPGFTTATWVMVATWSQMVPFPYSSNQYSYERNTFQAVLAMDSFAMKSFVSFRYLDIKTKPVRPAMMGIQAVDSGFSYNYAGDVYQLPHVVGVGTSAKPIIGLSMFDTSGSLSLVPSNVSCNTWVYNETLRNPNVIDNVDEMTPCPCSGFQAMFSPTHAWLTDTDCFVTVAKYSNNMGMKCCYDRNAWMWSYHWQQWGWMWTSVWLGDLIVNPVYEAGGYTEYNPLYYPEQAKKEEQAKRDCCLYSTSCSSYYSVRPIKNCDGFIPPDMGSTVGDPHITTYDGHTYDYNGIGEYWLIKSSALSVQVRTVQAKDNKGGLVNASVFGAFAVQIPQKLNQNMTDKVFLRMVSDANLELLVIPVAAVPTVNLTDWVRNVTRTPVSDTISIYNGFVLRRLSAGAGLVVTISTGTSLIFRLESGQIGLTVTPGPELMKNTNGLLGTYDSNAKNDYTLPNGTVLPIYINTETVYTEFGESWRTKSDESIMFYEAGIVHSTYQNPSFLPMFVPQFSSPAEKQEAEAMCGGNEQCLLDYAATGNNQMASATIANNEAVNSTTHLFESSQPVINGSQTLFVTVGKQFATTYTTTNADGSTVTSSMSGLPSGATFNPTSGIFSWLPLAMEPVGNLSVSAVSANGVPALSIAVAVFMCDGCNNQGSCDFSTSIPTYNMNNRYQTVTCSCFKGYSGSSCATVYDQCASKPCGVDATCESLPPGTVNEYGLPYNCTDCAIGQELNGGKCVDAAVSDLNSQNNQSACLSFPCQNNGLCEGTNITYNCTCLPGTTGFNCEIVLYTEASTNPAQELNSSSTTVTQTSQSTTPNVAPKLRNDISFYSSLFALLMLHWLIVNVIRGL